MNTPQFVAPLHQQIEKELQRVLSSQNNNHTRVNSLNEIQKQLETQRTMSQVYQPPHVYDNYDNKQH